jgi:2-iminobutanoate/2-iminopropanoate deaminase
MVIERFDPFDGAFGFSFATRLGSLVFTCGMSGFDPETGTAPEDLEQEVRFVFSNLATILEGVGSSLDHVLEQTTFLVGDPAAVYPVFNEVRKEVFGADLPASTAVFVQALAVPGFRVEVKLVAEVPGRDG